MINAIGKEQTGVEGAETSPLKRGKYGEVKKGRETFKATCSPTQPPLRPIIDFLLDKSRVQSC